MDRTPSAAPSSAAVAFPDAATRPVADQRTDATGITDVRTAGDSATRDGPARVAYRCGVDSARLVGQPLGTRCVGVSGHRAGCDCGPWRLRSAGRIAGPLRCSRVVVDAAVPGLAGRRP